jgi:protein ImuB
MLAGPERIEAGWWDEKPVSRDYFVARNPRGETLWVYRELSTPRQWYLHGVFA